MSKNIGPFSPDAELLYFALWVLTESVCVEVRNAANKIV